MFEKKWLETKTQEIIPCPKSENSRTKATYLSPLLDWMLFHVQGSLQRAVRRQRKNSTIKFNNVVVGLSCQLDAI